MRGNILGKMMSMTSFGESHGPALGVVLDGVPSNLDFDLGELQKELDRRAPGRLAGTTARKEADKAEVLSGIFNGKTLGSPIAIVIKNTNQKSEDYDKLKDEYRPGHADKTYMDKFGIRDHRGGGRSSGRETIARVVAGYFAGLVVPTIKVRAYINKLGPFQLDNPFIDSIDGDFGNYSFPISGKDKEIADYLEKLKEQGESVGGQISIVVENCPAGLGEPAFDKLKADLAKAILSIGACVSFSFGLGEKMALAKGSEVSSRSDAFGGIEGGISNGQRICMQATFKPTSTIGKKALEGRHDPCIIPRAIPVVESMVKFMIADHFLRQQAYSF